MKKTLLTASLLATLLWSCQSPPQAPEPPKVTRIAFGSCGHQDRPQPVLQQAAALRPDAFVFLGDNIYGDTYDMDTLRNKYQRWMAQPAYQALKDSTRILATWDDHDYGWNDTGRHYAEISRLQHPGLYPIYDVTASGITSTWGFATPNDHRIEGPVMENHFGLLEVDCAKGELSMKAIDVDGAVFI